VKALIAVITGVALLSAAPAFGATPKKVVRVGDNYLAPQTLKVKSGTKVTWRWPGYDEAGDVHEVKLASGPKGVKKFRSEAASTDYTFKRKLTVPGRYRIACMMHDGMRMTIRVRR
jgi:plastocyanin